MTEWNKLVEEAQTAVTHAFEAADKMADRIEELERDKVLDDGRPCVTDVFLAAAIEQLDDKWDFFEAVKCWCEGDWEGALEGIELEGKE
jgi:hypothetical protein